MACTVNPGDKRHRTHNPIDPRAQTRSTERTPFTF